MQQNRFVSECWLAIFEILATLAGVDSWWRARVPINQFNCPFLVRTMTHSDGET